MKHAPPPRLEQQPLAGCLPRCGPSSTACPNRSSPAKGVRFDGRDLDPDQHRGLFALGLSLADLSPADLRAAGFTPSTRSPLLIAGFSSPTSAISRRLAERLGERAARSSARTRVVRRTMAAFVNGTTAREIESTAPISPRRGGRIRAMCRCRSSRRPGICAMRRAAFHSSRAGGLKLTAMSIAPVSRASISRRSRASRRRSERGSSWARSQMMNCLAIVTVANNLLNQTRRNDLTMWKAAAAGRPERPACLQRSRPRRAWRVPACRSKVRRAGASTSRREPFELDGLGGSRLRIHDVMMKPRAACAATISSILAAGEGCCRDQRPVECGEHRRDHHGEDARRLVGSSPQHWDPTTRETADRSIPYVVAAALADGTVGPRQFDDEHLVDPVIAGSTKVSIAVDDTYSAAYAARLPRHYWRA